MPSADVFIGLEAAFHYEDKDQLFARLHSRVRLLTLLEICVEDDSVIHSDPLLSRPLCNAWSLERYLAVLSQAGFSAPEVLDVSDRTFDGFRDYLRCWDAHGYDENRAILRQLRMAFSRMAELARTGRIRYVRLSALTG